MPRPKVLDEATTALNCATRRWLRCARITDDPAGDLIADMRRDAADPAFPALFSNVGEMCAYLRARDACAEALEALPVVWRRYSRWLDRNCGFSARGRV